MHIYKHLMLWNFGNPPFNDILTQFKIIQSYVQSKLNITKNGNFFPTLFSPVKIYINICVLLHIQQKLKVLTFIHQTLLEISNNSNWGKKIYDD